MSAGSIYWVYGVGVPGEADSDKSHDHSHTDSHTHSHSHSHDHSNALVGGWAVWGRRRSLQVVLAGVIIAAVITIFGLISLWPDGLGRTEALQNAEEFGLSTERFKATVSQTLEGPCSYSTPETPQTCRVFSFLLSEGPDSGSQISLPEVNVRFDKAIPKLLPGDAVVLGYEDSTTTYFYSDRDRRSPMLWLAAIFAIVVIALGRWRGIMALLSMALSLAVLVGFVAPSVLDGNDPLVVSIVAASAIAFLSLYLTHGPSPTTTVALGGTLGALGLTMALSRLFFELTQISGLATEEALILPYLAEDLRVSSLLLGGAVIGALGALDDVTVTQVATVAELRRHNPNTPIAEIVASGIRVGRDHIASTVNTLVLAYAGASMPLLLLFAISDQSLSTVANAELIAVEIVRTLCGSIGLVAAVPITTSLAAIATANEAEQ